MRLEFKTDPYEADGLQNSLRLDVSARGKNG